MSKKINSFGSTVSQLRSRLNLSQSDLERRSRGDNQSGVTAAYVSVIESGQVSPESLTVKKLNSLAHALNMPATLLFAMAAGIKSENSEIVSQIVSYANQLPLSRQRDVLMIVKGFYSAGNGFDRAEQESIYESEIKVVRDPRYRKSTVK